MNSQSPQMLILQNQEEAQEEELNLKDYSAVLKRRWKLILLVFIIVVGLTVVYLLRTPRQYEATAVVKIPMTGTGSGLVAALGSFLPLGTSDDIATEIEIIKGRNIAETVISELELDKKDKNLESEWRKIVSVFLESLRVKQRGRTNLVDITTVGDSPEEARDIANHVAVGYVQLSDSSKQKVWNDLIEQMDGKLEQTRTDLERSRTLLHEYEADEGITTAFGPLLIGGQEGSNPPRILLESTQAVAGLKASIIQMEIELETLRRSFSEGDPKVIGLKNQITESKLKFEKEEEKVIEKYDKQFGLTNLAAEVVFNQQLYSLLVSKQEELKAQYIIQHRTPEIIEKAVEALYPSKPRRRLILMLSAVLGLLLGIGAALFREYMDDSIHEAKDIKLSIDLPVLGSIPCLGKLKPRFTGKFRHKKNPGQEALINYTDSSEKDYDRELYKESYIMLQLELMATANGKMDHAVNVQRQDGLALLVTSSLPKEGKSIIAANLAIAIAQTGREVLLVDSDCRNPFQHELLGLDTQMGLVDILAGNALLDDTISKSSLENLSVIASGVKNGLPDASTLFISPHMEEFIRSSKEKFDVIIFDSTSIISRADSAAIGSKVDGVVLVIKANDTQEKSILQAKQKIQNSGGNVLGIVLNFCDQL